MPPIKRKGGPYKRYLTDADVPIPRSTAWLRRRQELAGNNDDDNLQHNLDDVNQEDFDDDIAEGSALSSASSSADSDITEPMDIESADDVSEVSGLQGSLPLPLKYLKHWFLLVFSITVFLKEKITREEFGKANVALQKFVQDISVLYPEVHSLYTFNMHMLLHIPKAVENFGALWASSTFPYENANGILTRFIRGSQGVPMQICTSFLRLRHVHQIGFEVFSKDCSSNAGKELLYSLLDTSHKTVRRTYQCGEGLRYFGGPIDYTLSLIEKASIQELLQQDIDSNAFSYQRLIVSRTIFHAEKGGVLRVRDNSIAKLKDGMLVVISSILLVKLSNVNELVSVCVCNLLQNSDSVICQDTDLAISSNNIMYTCQRSERIVSVKPQSISQKCVAIPFGDLICVVPLVNTIERD